MQFRVGVKSAKQYSKAVMLASKVVSRCVMARPARFAFRSRSRKPTDLLNNIFRIVLLQ